MHGAYPLYIEEISDFLETSFESVEGVYQNFQIQDVGEYEAHFGREVLFTVRKRNAWKDLEELAKVLAAVEAYPLDFGVEHQISAYELVSKLNRVNAVEFESLEVESTLLEQENAVVQACVIVQVLLEVELPGVNAFGVIAVFVWEREAQLDEFECVDVGF